MADINTMALTVEKEANIETLVKAKGFEQCIAVINGENATVVVNGKQLLANQISQINEIVYEQTGIKPANIRIVTK